MVGHHWYLAQLESTLDSVSPFHRVCHDVRHGRFFKPRQLFDVKSLFFRPKRSNGQWDGPLYPFRWGNGFTEASAAQARFDAPQEVEGLKEARPMRRRCQRMWCEGHHWGNTGVWGLKRGQCRALYTWWP